jgi:hypothetical protein
VSTLAVTSTRRRDIGLEPGLGDVCLICGEQRRRKRAWGGSCLELRLGGGMGCRVLSFHLTVSDVRVGEAFKKQKGHPGAGKGALATVPEATASLTSRPPLFEPTGANELTPSHTALSSRGKRPLTYEFERPHARELSKQILTPNWNDVLALDASCQHHDLAGDRLHNALVLVGVAVPVVHRGNAALAMVGHAV